MPVASSAREMHIAREPEHVARAAWLHYVGGLTQSDVARHLNVPTIRVHRYIARARQEGLVRTFVDVSCSECMHAEMALSERYGLGFCRIAMDVPEAGELPLRGLGAAGGEYLMQVVAAAKHDVVGIGHGRTIAAAVRAMARTDGANVRFVSLLGGLTRSYAANVRDVIHRLAEKTDAESWFLPAPLFANSPEDKGVMMAQREIALAMRMIDRTTLNIVGIGGLDASGGSASATALDGPEAAADLHAAGARAEILGQFIDRDGQVMRTEYDDRVMAPPLESLRGRETVAITGGVRKHEAIKAALKSGLLTGLIIDEATARSLVGEAGPDRAAAGL